MMAASFSPYLAWAVFSLLCALLLTLPFVPAYREWRYPTDVEPLRISANYSADIDHFAHRLHADVSARLGTGTQTGYTDFEILSGPVRDWRQATSRMISTVSLHSDSAIRSAPALYVQGDLQGGADSSFSALYATGDITLGAESEVHDWAHADGILRMGGNSTALRRVSAGTAIVLGNEAWFERLQAPVLYFGTHAAEPADQHHDTPEPASYAELPDAIERAPGHFMVRGDCSLPSGKIYRGTLLVTGFLLIAPGTTVVGDVKAREGVSVAGGARVEGALTCEKRIYLFSDAAAFGPVISESDILIGSGVVIGRPGVETTVSARNIIAEEGCVVHGAVWAHDVGMVKPA